MVGIEDVLAPKADVLVVLVMVFVVSGHCLNYFASRLKVKSTVLVSSAPTVMD